MLERNSGRYVLRGRKSTAGSEGGPRVGPRISFDVGEGRKETSNATDPDPRRGPHDRRDAGIGRGRGPRRASDDERSERKHGGYVRDDHDHSRRFSGDDRERRAERRALQPQPHRCPEGQDGRHDEQRRPPDLRSTHRRRGCHEPQGQALQRDHEGEQDLPSAGTRGRELPGAGRERDRRERCTLPASH